MGFVIENARLLQQSLNFSVNILSKCLLFQWSSFSPDCVMLFADFSSQTCCRLQCIHLHQFMFVQRRQCRYETSVSFILRHSTPYHFPRFLCNAALSQNAFWARSSARAFQSRYYVSLNTQRIHPWTNLKSLSLNSCLCKRIREHVL